MKKNFMDIILDQFMREDNSPVDNTVKSDEEKTLEEQAKEEAKKREKEKLNRLLKNQAIELEERKQRAKRKAKAETRRLAKESDKLRRTTSLEAPTKLLEWKQTGSHGERLSATMDGFIIFEIRRGLVNFELKPVADMKERMKNAKTGNIFSSPDVQKLKLKADKIIGKVLDFETKKTALKT